LDDASDEENGGRNKGKTDENKKANERLKLEAEATNMSMNIDEMVKSKEVYMAKTLKAYMADKKNAMKLARWETIQEDDKRKAALEERRIQLVEEKRTMMELITDEFRTMMMNSSTMDALIREWWDMRRERRSLTGGGKRALMLQ
jgi:hypothetical protein